MSDLLVHPQTGETIKLFLAKPSHALLLIGPAGSGKRALAENVAQQLLGLREEENLESYPYFNNLAPTPPKREISIEAVRQVIKEMKLKTPGSRSVRRVVLVDQADNMSHEAQNALLKVLEEPTSSTTFILTAPSADGVLPTVASRAQQIYVRPVNSKLAQKYYGENLPSTKIEIAWQLSRGKVGLLQALLLQDGPHPLQEAVAEAKKLLSQSQYERLLSIDRRATNKEDMSRLLDGLSKLLRALYGTQSVKNDATKRQKLLDNWLLIERLQSALEANASPKLIGLKLVLNLRV